MAAGALV